MFGKSESSRIKQLEKELTNVKVKLGTNLKLAEQLRYSRDEIAEKLKSYEELTNEERKEFKELRIGMGELLIILSNTHKNVFNDKNEKGGVADPLEDYIYYYKNWYKGSYTCGDKKPVTPCRRGECRCARDLLEVDMEKVGTKSYLGTLPSKEICKRLITRLSGELDTQKKYIDILDKNENVHREQLKSIKEQCEKEKAYIYKEFNAIQQATVDVLMEKGKKYIKEKKAGKK